MTQRQGNTGGERCAELNPRCVLCGHSETVVDGICQYLGTNIVIGGEQAMICGCKCVFPAPPEAEASQFDKEFTAWQEHMEQSIEATQQSEILTAEDFNVRVNARADDDRPFTPVPAEAAARHCGFCGKTDHEVLVLIQAPVGFICNECVKICADIIQKNKPSTAITSASAAVEAAREIVPDCLSRTCFIKDCGYDHCWGCDDSKAERERVAAIISKYFPPTEAAIPAGALKQKDDGRRSE